MTSTPPDPQELVGRTVHLFLAEDLRDLYTKKCRIPGFRVGRILSVKSGPRIGFRSARFITGEPYAPEIHTIPAHQFKPITAARTGIAGGDTITPFPPYHIKGSPR